MAGFFDDKTRWKTWAQTRADWVGETSIKNSDKFESEFMGVWPVMIPPYTISVSEWFSDISIFKLINGLPEPSLLHPPRHFRELAVALILRVGGEYPDGVHLAELIEQAEFLDHIPQHTQGRQTRIHDRNMIVELAQRILRIRNLNANIGRMGLAFIGVFDFQRDMPHYMGDPRILQDDWRERLQDAPSPCYPGGLNRLCGAVPCGRLGYPFVAPGLIQRGEDVDNNDNNDHDAHPMIHTNDPLSKRERRVMQLCGVVREVFRGPGQYPDFRSEWRTDTVVAMANTIYDTGDFGVMPILADALQDADCDDLEVLAHLRHGTNHSRGCWALRLARR
jgi:hypothetical protein